VGQSEVNALSPNHSSTFRIGTRKSTGLYIPVHLDVEPAIFIGYSLDDPDFRQIWHVVTQRLGKTRRMAYTLAVNAKPADVARFERRGVKVINLPGTREKYGEVLSATFRELREYVRDNVIAASKVTEEQPLRELLLPRDAATRLCFFSLPLELLPFYWERVFPVVEQAGFVPVTADDLIAPGDNVSAKLDALIDRASVMVAEVSSDWTMAEFRMAIARLNALEGNSSQQKPFQLIVVVNDIDKVPVSIHSFRVLRRPNLLTDDAEGFVADLGGTLRAIAEATGMERQAEPRRLFEVREYRASVISAMTLLEAKLRERFNKVPWPQARRPLSMRSLIDQALAEGLVTPEVRNRIDSWMRVRNEVVHSSMAVSRAQALEIVNGVLALIEQMGM
jgi:hypothetical protein